MNRLRFTQNTVLFLAGCWLAVALALVWEPAVRLADTFVPLGQDSFYHATRILDAASSGRSLVFQFDPYMHAPEGNWVNWPWAYDSMLAGIVVGIKSMGVQVQDLQILVYAPLIWIPLNVGLCLLLANLLGFPFALRLALLIGFVCNPLVRASHGLGMLDHHQAEQALFLATMCAWLAWQKQPGRRGLAFLAGFVAGFAPAIHTSLFLCLPPIALAALLCWSRSQLPGLRASLVFAAGAVVGITLATGPAVFPGDRLFVYHTLSWFHVAVVVATAAGVVLLSYLHFSWQRLIALLTAAVLGMLLMGSYLGEGLSYMAGTENMVAEVTESVSYIGNWLRGELPTRELIILYTPWAVLVPVSLLGCIVGLWRSRSALTIGFLCFSLLGLALLSGQFRFHVFGDVFLVAVPLFAASIFIRDRGPGLAWCAPVVAALLTIPVIPTLLSAPPVAMDEDYPLLLPIYRAANVLCRNEPGVIVANSNDGHYLRFHSDCPVLTNNFLVDDLARAKVAQSQQIMAAAAANQNLLEQHSWMRYLLVRVFYSDLNKMDNEQAPAPRIHLLQANAADLDYLELVWQSSVPVNLAGAEVPLARIFRVKQPASGDR